MKRLLLVLLVVLLGYWMLTEPAALANLTKEGATSGWDAATALFRGVIDFLRALFA